jgi:hypothetical protein
MWAGFSWLGVRFTDGYHKHCDEIWDSIQGGEALHQLNDYQLLEKNFAPRS